MREQNDLYLLRYTKMLTDTFGYRAALSDVTAAIGKGALHFDDLRERDTLSDTDAAFFAEFTDVVRSLRAIVAHPHLRMEQREVVKGLYGAYRADAGTVRDTCRDGRNFSRGADGKMRPDRIHTYESEETFDIYENRFIAAAIDALIRLLSMKADEFFGRASELGKTVGDRALSMSDVAALSSFDPFFAGDANEKQKNTVRRPLLSSGDGPVIDYLQNMIVLRTRLYRLCHTAFYRVCRRESTAQLSALRATNILLHDARYNAVYRFYIKHLLSPDGKEKAETLAPLYANYCFFRTLSALCRLGFSVADPRAEIVCTNGVYIGKDLALRRGALLVTLATDDARGMTATVALLPAGEHALKHTESYPAASYYFIYLPEPPSPMDTEERDRYAGTLIEGKRNEGYTDAYVMTTYALAQQNRIVPMVPFRERIDANAESMWKEILFFTEGSPVIYTRKCPVCGSFNLDTEDRQSYTCLDCNSHYLVLAYGRGKNSRDILWLQRVESRKKRL